MNTPSSYPDLTEQARTATVARGRIIDRHLSALERYLAVLGAANAVDDPDAAKAARRMPTDLAQISVADVMTRDPVWVPVDAGLKSVATTMSRSGVSAVPVRDGEKVVGVVSVADLVAKIASAETAESAGRLSRTARRKAVAETARDLMSSPAITIEAHESVVAAARKTATHRVHRLPVVDGSGRLVGVVSESDLFAIFERSDASINHQVSGLVERILCPDVNKVVVTVADGVVTLDGSIDTRTGVAELLRRVKGLAGVVAVHDHLVCSDGADSH